MKKFKVIYKDVETGDLASIEVVDMKAAECKKKQGTTQGLYLGNSYITGMDIKKISETKDDLALAAPKTCGRCENGWLFRQDPETPSQRLAYPCTCNQKGKVLLSEYRDKLQKQPWFSKTQEHKRQESQRQYFQEEYLTNSYGA